MPDTRTQDVKMAADQAAQASASAAQQNGKVLSNSVRRTGEASADAMERVSGAARETMSRGTTAVAEGQRKMVQEAADRFEDVSRKVADAVQGTTADMRTLLTLPNAAESGLQDFQKSLAGLIEGVVRTNMRATQELFRLTNPGGFIQLQQRFVTEYMDALMQGSTTMVRAIRQTADQTLPRLEQHLAKRQQSQNVAAE